ncbi:MAG: non-canonical purine NTP pyrophosphatase, RdgB/HAM1 family [Micavibrio sp.]|nr:non-canonical purine NTP pyrophosphatase, RdgB/HAM1 family [Micavibrio sp.]|tara:strand:+ start:95 stop:703 length:609 start_codon:yes stop_codon:yes gene_type:complete
MRKLTSNKLVLASHNKGKLEEFSALFKPYDIEVVLAGDLGLPEPEETGVTFEENAVLKAKAASLATDLPALADDSGLCVNALDGAPGVYSARYAINPTTNQRDFEYGMEKLHKEIGENADRSAYFVSVLALVWPDGHVETVEGRCVGDIIWPPRHGQGGFGYDPCFQPLGHDKTFAEDAVYKEKVAHRHKAFAELIEQCLPL